MKAIHYLLRTAAIVPVVYLGLKLEPLETQVDLHSPQANVRISIVHTSYWDRITPSPNAIDNPKVDNRSIIGPDGEQPGNRLGTVTIAEWGKVYTLPSEMVRDCFAPHKDARDWKIQTADDGVYIGTMMGTEVGKTLIWWQIGSDRKARRWVFPMSQRRDLSTLPKPTDIPVETRPLMSFDE